jgi:flagellar protein FliS
MTAEGAEDGMEPEAVKAVQSSVPHDAGALEAGLAHWRQASIRTLSQKGLMVFVLDGVAGRVATARTAIREGRIEAAHEALVAGQDALNAVARALNPTWPPTENLRRLFDFVVRRLRDSNWQKDAAPLDEVEPILRELADGFRNMGGQEQPALTGAAGAPRGVDFAG